MAHTLVIQPLSQITRDVTGTIVRQKSGFVNNIGLIAT